MMYNVINKAKDMWEDVQRTLQEMNEAEASSGHQWFEISVKCKILWCYKTLGVKESSNDLNTPKHLLWNIFVSCCVINRIPKSSPLLSKN